MLTNRLTLLGLIERVFLYPSLKEKHNLKNVGIE